MKLSDIGIPPQYLLSACRFYQDIQVPIEKIQQLFHKKSAPHDAAHFFIPVNSAYCATLKSGLLNSGTIWMLKSAVSVRILP